MRRRLELGLHEATLVVCTVTLVALIYAEGWIWPLQAAAVVLPITLLLG
jgi:hypothetical protein